MTSLTQGIYLHTVVPQSPTVLSVIQHAVYAQLNDWRTPMSLVDAEVEAMQSLHEALMRDATSERRPLNVAEMPLLANIWRFPTPTPFDRCNLELRLKCDQFELRIVANQFNGPSSFHFTYTFDDRARTKYGFVADTLMGNIKDRLCFDFPVQLYRPTLQCNFGEAYDGKPTFQNAMPAKLAWMMSNLESEAARFHNIMDDKTLKDRWEERHGPLPKFMGVHLW